MKFSFNSLYHSLRHLKKPWQILLFVVANLVLSYAASAFSLLIYGEGLENPISRETVFKQFMTGVLLIPLLETLIFQYAIIESIRGKLRLRYVAIISAACFSLTHLYSTPYLLYAFFSGLIMSVLYFLQESTLRSFGMVWLAHLLFNLLAFLLRLL